MPGLPSLSARAKGKLAAGDLLETGFRPNSGDLKRTTTSVYLTGTRDAATWSTALALGEGGGRIYVVEPTGDRVDDLNLTNATFPGNPTTSDRSRAPLRVVHEVVDWTRHSPEELGRMRDNLERIRKPGIAPIA